MTNLTKIMKSASVAGAMDIESNKETEREALPVRFTRVEGTMKVEVPEDGLFEEETWEWVEIATGKVSRR